MVIVAVRVGPPIAPGSSAPTRWKPPNDDDGDDGDEDEDSDDAALATPQASPS
jgi:hypothetical protein